MSKNNMFVFPYDKVRYGSNIIIYGAGAVGQAFHAQVAKNNYARVIKWVDKKNEEGVDIDYLAYDFDYLVIAIEAKIIYEEIANFLLDRGVPREKIVWENPRVTYFLPDKEPAPKYISGYSVEKNVQYLLALLKKRKIKRIVASPGTTNICLVKSAQNDPFFKIYSSIDERSAAYLAGGMASQYKEPVVLSCTGATASRNYIPGLTEAYYRKLPIIAVTSSQYFGRTGNNVAQMIDRSILPRDIVMYQARIPMLRTIEDEWFCKLEINKALIATQARGGGPVHIDLETDYSTEFSVRELPSVRQIDLIEPGDDFPVLDSRQVAVLIGAHKPFSDKEKELLEEFCEKYNAVVLCDLIGNYFGKYCINPALISSQGRKDEILKSVKVMIYIGDTTGYSYISIEPQEVWRVNPDGEIRDLFRATSKVFSMSEKVFFGYYASIGSKKRMDYFSRWHDADERLRGIVNDIPFSNAWLAHASRDEFPSNAIVHLAILNSLRVWNLFLKNNDFPIFSNTGGFGIDGCMSAMIGAAIADEGNHLYFGVIGDLSFFYDMNVLGNRHIRNNVRIILINNGMGAEFKNYGHMGRAFGKDTDDYIAAAGHFGKQSATLVRHYAEDLGFEYMVARNKEEYKENMKRFFMEEFTDRPMLMEVFTNFEDEGLAIEILYNLERAN